MTGGIRSCDASIRAVVNRRFSIEPLIAEGAREDTDSDGRPGSVVASPLVCRARLD